MNRTSFYLALAGGLAAVALVLGLPRVQPRAGQPADEPQRPSGPTTAPPSQPTSPPTPAGSLSVTTRVSHPYVPLGRSDVFATVDVRGVDVPGQARLPVNLCLVLDRSGSMSGQKLAQAKDAARRLVSLLGSKDTLTIVHFGSDVTSLPGLLATDENRGKLLAFIDTIWDAGGTNISQALKTGRGLLERTRGGYDVNRLILVSDGQPTEGVTDASALLGIVRDVRASGTSVSSIGVGNDYNEALMESFAEAGAGAYGYIQDASQLSTIFERDLNAAGTQVARNVRLELTVPSGVTFHEVLGYTVRERRTSASGEQVLSLDLPDFAAGQTERLVARFSVQGSVANASLDVARVGLGYVDLLADGPRTASAQVSSLVSDSVELVAQKRDKEAAIYAARARSALNVQEAGEALKRGERAEAEQLLRKNFTIWDEAASVAGQGAVQADVDSQNVLQLGLQRAQSEDEVKSFSKGARSKARQDFGLMGSTY